MTDFHIKISSETAAGRLDASSALHYAVLAGLRFAALVLPYSRNSINALPELAKDIRRISLYANVEACLAVELRHIPPAILPSVAEEARACGADMILVYGETLGDQVAEGTNFAAVEAGADLITHPGLIDEKTAAYAAEKGVALEFTSCPRHALSNAHTAAMALRFGCPLVRGSAAEKPGEITPRSAWPAIIQGSDVFGRKNGQSSLSVWLEKSEASLVQNLLKKKI